MKASMLWYAAVPLGSQDKAISVQSLTLGTRGPLPAEPFPWWLAATGNVEGQKPFDTRFLKSWKRKRDVGKEHDSRGFPMQHDHAQQQWQPELLRPGLDMFLTKAENVIYSKQRTQKYWNCRLRLFKIVYFKQNRLDGTTQS